MPDTDALIQRWREGDQSAAEALYDRCRDSTFRLAYGLLGNVAEAEDAAQDALTYVLVHIERYEPERAAFSTWLHMIVVSRCRDRLRSRRLRLLLWQRWWAQEGPPASPARPPESAAVHAQERSEVLLAVQALSQPLREAILLRFWAGHTYQEMAQIMGCPLRTAQSRVRLACQRLRQILAWEQSAELSRAE